MTIQRTPPATDSQQTTTTDMSPIFSTTPLGGQRSTVPTQANSEVLDSRTDRRDMPRRPNSHANMRQTPAPASGTSQSNSYLQTGMNQMLPPPLTRHERPTSSFRDNTAPSYGSEELDRLRAAQSLAETYERRMGQRSWPFNPDQTGRFVYEEVLVNQIRENRQLKQNSGNREVSQTDQKSDSTVRAQSNNTAVPTTGQLPMSTATYTAPIVTQDIYMSTANVPTQNVFLGSNQQTQREQVRMTNQHVGFNGNRTEIGNGRHAPVQLFNSQNQNQPIFATREGNTNFGRPNPMENRESIVGSNNVDGVNTGYGTIDWNAVRTGTVPPPLPPGTHGMYGNEPDRLVAPEVAVNGNRSFMFANDVAPPTIAQNRGGQNMPNDGNNLSGLLQQNVRLHMNDSEPTRYVQTDVRQGNNASLPNVFQSGRSENRQPQNNTVYRIPSPEREPRHVVNQFQRQVPVNVHDTGSATRRKVRNSNQNHIIYQEFPDGAPTTNFKPMLMNNQPHLIFSGKDGECFETWYDLFKIHCCTLQRDIRHGPIQLPSFLKGAPLDVYIRMYSKHGANFDPRDVLVLLVNRYGNVRSKKSTYREKLRMCKQYYTPLTEHYNNFELLYEGTYDGEERDDEYMINTFLDMLNENDYVRVRTIVDTMEDPVLWDRVIDRLRRRIEGNQSKDKVITVRAMSSNNATRPTVSQAPPTRFSTPSPRGNRSPRNLSADIVFSRISEHRNSNTNVTVEWLAAQLKDVRFRTDVQKVVDSCCKGEYGSAMMKIALDAMKYLPGCFTDQEIADERARQAASPKSNPVVEASVANARSVSNVGSTIYTNTQYGNRGRGSYQQRGGRERSFTPIPMSERKCYNCDEFGHLSRNCQLPRRTNYRGQGMRRSYNNIPVRHGQYFDDQNTSHNQTYSDETDPQFTVHHVQTEGQPTNSQRMAQQSFNADANRSREQDQPPPPGPTSSTDTSFQTPTSSVNGDKFPVQMMSEEFARYRANLTENEVASIDVNNLSFNGIGPNTYDQCMYEWCMNDKQRWPPVEFSRLANYLVPLDPEFPYAHWYRQYMTWEPPSYMFLPWMEQESVVPLVTEVPAFALKRRIHCETNYSIPTEDNFSSCFDNMCEESVSTVRVDNSDVESEASVYFDCDTPTVSDTVCTDETPKVVEDIDNVTPVFIPSTIPTAIQLTNEVESVECTGETEIRITSPVNPVMPIDFATALSRHALEFPVMSAFEAAVRGLQQQGIVKLEDMEIAVFILHFLTGMAESKIPALADTGAGFTVMQLIALLKAGISMDDIKLCNHRHVSGFGGTAPILGTTEVAFQIGKSTFKHKVHVIKDNVDIPLLVLGLDWLRKEDVIIHPKFNSILINGETITVGKSIHNCRMLPVRPVADNGEVDRLSAQLAIADSNNVSNDSSSQLEEETPMDTVTPEPQDPIQEESAGQSTAGAAPSDHNELTPSPAGLVQPLPPPPHTYDEFQRWADYQANMAVVPFPEMEDRPQREMTTVEETTATNNWAQVNPETLQRIETTIQGEENWTLGLFNRTQFQDRNGPLCNEDILHQMRINYMLMAKVRYQNAAAGRPQAIVMPVEEDEPTEDVRLPAPPFTQQEFMEWATITREGGAHHFWDINERPDRPLTAAETAQATAHFEVAFPNLTQMINDRARFGTARLLRRMGYPPEGEHFEGRVARISELHRQIEMNRRRATHIAQMQAHMTVQQGRNVHEVQVFPGNREWLPSPPFTQEEFNHWVTIREQGHVEDWDRRARPIREMTIAEHRMARRHYLTAFPDMAIACDIRARETVLRMFEARGEPTHGEAFEEEVLNTTHIYADMEVRREREAYLEVIDRQERGITERPEQLRQTPQQMREDLEEIHAYEHGDYERRQPQPRQRQEDFQQQIDRASAASAAMGSEPTPMEPPPSYEEAIRVNSKGVQATPKTTTTGTGMIGKWQKDKSTQRSAQSQSSRPAQRHYWTQVDERQLARYFPTPYTREPARDSDEELKRNTLEMVARFARGLPDLWQYLPNNLRRSINRNIASALDTTRGAEQMALATTQNRLLRDSHQLQQQVNRTQEVTSSRTWFRTSPQTTEAQTEDATVAELHPSPPGPGPSGQQ